MRPTPDEIKARALELWREREMAFPARCRRMTPDSLDMATGAWMNCVMKAWKELRPEGGAQ